MQTRSRSSSRCQNSQDNSSNIYNCVIRNVPSKYRNLFLRVVFGTVMLLIPPVIGRVGVSGIIIFLECIVVQCYSEVISIAYKQHRQLSIPLFRFLQWFFLSAATFYANGDIFALVVNNFLKRESFLTLFTKYHKMIAFLLYVVGIIIFVLSLKKKNYKTQFSMFCWYQLTLTILMIPSQLFLRTLFHGMIWIILPHTMIIINDTFAYFFGLAFGRTPLIKLSPKKTWEGFIGGGICTVIGSIIVCNFLVRQKQFYCPVNFDKINFEFVMECPRPDIFTKSFWSFPPFLKNLLSFVGVRWDHLEYYPMYIHAIVMGLFASLIAPFGGFLASGFKRAFSIKDFGDSIPGHGGMMDRMDCQLLMCIFVNVYIQTFLKAATPADLMKKFTRLRPELQTELYQQIVAYMINRNTTLVDMASP